MSNEATEKTALCFVSQYYHTIAQSQPGNLKIVYSERSTVTLTTPTETTLFHGQDDIDTVFLPQLSQKTAGCKVQLLKIDYHKSPGPDGSIVVCCQGVYCAAEAETPFMQYFVLAPTARKTNTFYIAHEHLCLQKTEEVALPESAKPNNNTKVDLISQLKTAVAPTANVHYKRENDQQQPTAATAVAEGSEKKPRRERVPRNKDNKDTAPAAATAAATAPAADAPKTEKPKRERKERKSKDEAATSAAPVAAEATAAAPAKKEKREKKSAKPAAASSDAPAAAATAEGAAATSDEKKRRFFVRLCELDTNWSYGEVRRATKNFGKVVEIKWIGGYDAILEMDTLDGAKALQSEKQLMIKEVAIKVKRGSLAEFLSAPEEPEKRERKPRRERPAAADE